MNIAVDVRSLMEGRLSGVEEYTYRIVRAMAQYGPQHEYRLFYNSYKPVRLPDFSGPVSQKGFKYPNKLFNGCQLMTGRPRWNKLLQADCFFVPNVRLLPVASNVPVVATAHDLSFERFPEFYSRKRRLWHKLVRPRRLMRRADRIIAVSEATKRDIIDLYGVPPEKIAVVYSGAAVLKPTADSERAAARQKYRLPEKYVLYLGTLEPRKNIPGIIRAYDAVAARINQDLVIAGSPGWLMGGIKQAARGAAAASRIHLAGFIEEADKQAVISGADLFVYPSFYEGFGFPPLEALLNGVPVITSHNSSLPEVVGEWAELIDPYQPAEIAGVMLELLREKTTVPEEVRRQVREKYSWERAARQTLAVIEETVREKLETRSWKLETRN